MTRKRHGLCAADMRMQLETIINSVSQKVSSAWALDLECCHAHYRRRAELASKMGPG